MHPRFEAFLQQDMREREDFQDSVIKLHALFDRQL
jgi:flagellar biosynthesis/type III secretory pathway ATPase